MSRRISQIMEHLNASDEQASLEIKKGSKIGKSILETINSFSNEPGLGGGTIVLGIQETGRDLLPHYTIVGVEDVDKFQKDLATQCADTFNLSIRPKISVESFEGKNVIIIDVEELPARMKPIYFKKMGLPKGAYRRIGSTDHHCTEDDLFFFYNKEDSYDSAVVEDSDLDDISYEAVALYRRLRKKVNAGAEELQYSDIDLLRSLNCIKKIEEEWKLTNCGLIVFGNKMALRRLVPMIRVDYIRLAGKEWVENPEERFISTLDLRGPLIELVHRTISAIADDLPTGFLLPEGQIQAQSKWQLPFRVLREAIVNAFIHRSYRVNQPIQILRYSNRIEIINAGFSLKPEETIGEPGSVNRNSFIASIFHETNLAETKGTGFKIMQHLMKSSDMLPPTFESNHTKNNFTLRLLLHNFLNETDIRWLSNFQDYSLSDGQKLALIFVREVGAIDNSTFRQLTGLKSSEAGVNLRDLRKNELLVQKGASKSTYYIAGKSLISFLPTMAEDLSTKAESLSTQSKGLSTQSKGLSTKAKGLSPQTEGLSPQVKSLSPQAGGLSPQVEIPDKLLLRINRIGKRTSNKEEMEKIIIELCKIRDFTTNELSSIIRRDEKYLKKNYLKKLLKEGRIRYTIPEMISHPKQKYTSKTKD